MRFKDEYVNDWTPEERQRYTDEVIGRFIAYKLKNDPDALKHGVFIWEKDENGNWVKPKEMDKRSARNRT